MGFNTNTSTTTLTAKLTPLGRKLLITSNSGLIKTFSLGDSDANYDTDLPLSTGEVPSSGGDVGANSSFSNSIGNNVKLRSALIVNSSGTLKKPVEGNSSDVTIETKLNGLVSTSGVTLTQTMIDRNDLATDSLVNLYYSFGLPLNTKEDTIYSGTTFANGGYSGTTLSGLASTKILVLAINNAIYGETIDGKTLKVVLPTSATTYSIYSTFQNTGIAASIQDANYSEQSSIVNFMGNNVALLFSDQIQKPNNDSSLSWATGFGVYKPFAVNNKQQFNLITDSNVNHVADTMVGIAYLDKGLVVITHPTIINHYTQSASTAATITFNSISTAVSQNITCIGDRGEFGLSTNKTYTPSDTPRISEIALYDGQDNLIAYGKTDRQILKAINQFLALSVKITL